MFSKAKTVAFWTEDYPRPEALVVTRVPPAVDVAIVGGGYTGLHAARELLGQGASVAVLEARTIGWGASSRNGGMTTVGIKAPAPVMIKRYGRELGTAFWRASLDSIDMVEQLTTGPAGIDCDFKRPGHLFLASKRSHFQKMRRSIEWYRETHRHELTLVEPDSLEREIGSSAFHGGLVDPLSGSLHPAKYVFGLAGEVAALGGALCENAPVTALERNGTGFELSSESGKVRAGEVLLATNGYTGGLHGQMRRTIFPVGSYIIVTEPLPTHIRQRVSPKGRVFYDSKNLLNYFRLTPDGRLLFGGRNRLDPDLDLHTSAMRLHQRLLEVFPYLRDVPISHSWSGRLGLSFDLMPHIQRVDGLTYAAGYCGHGVSIASYLGREAGRLISRQITESPFAEIKAPTRFFYRKRPWFLPLAASYYRFLDWLP